MKIKIILFVVFLAYTLTLKASTNIEKKQISPVDFVRSQYLDVDIQSIQERHEKVCRLVNCRDHQYLNNEEEKIVKARLWKNITEYLKKKKLTLTTLNKDMVFKPIEELPKDNIASSRSLKINQEHNFNRDIKLTEVIITNKTKSVSYTLNDLYNSLNQQKKENWHSYSISMLNQLSKQFLDSLIIDLVLNNKKHQSHQEFSWFLDMIYNAVAYDKARSKFVTSNEIRTKAMKNISQSDIKNYYKRHINQFTEISKVDCQHVSINSQDQANHAHEALKRGVPFSEVVTKFSQHVDKNQAIPGLIENITNLDAIENKKMSFLHSLCLQQAETEFSLPTRTEDGFEILKVTNVNRITMPVSSPVVQATIKKNVTN